MAIEGSGVRWRGAGGRDACLRRFWLPRSGCASRQRRPVSAPWRGSASGGAHEDEHALDVPGDGHEVPLAAHTVEATQQKLTEPKHRLDDAEHRLRRVVAPGGEVLALR